MGSATALDSSVAHELPPLICFGGITFIRIQPDVDKGLVTDVLPEEKRALEKHLQRLLG